MGVIVLLGALTGSVRTVRSGRRVHDHTVLIFRRPRRGSASASRSERAKIGSAAHKPQRRGGLPDGRRDIVGGMTEGIGALPVHVRPVDRQIDTVIRSVRSDARAIGTMMAREP